MRPTLHHESVIFDPVFMVHFALMVAGCSLYDRKQEVVFGSLRYSAGPLRAVMIISEKGELSS